MPAADESPAWLNDAPPDFPADFPADFAEAPPDFPTDWEAPAAAPPKPKVKQDYLAGLNAQQREAVTTVDGPMLLLAGAGSGKTRVITFRIAHLVADCGVRAENVLAVTFTNKAAGEMKERVEKLLGDGPKTSSPLLSTFHALCVRILRRDIDKLEKGYTRSFTIYDSDDQQRLLKQCIRDCGFDDKVLTPRQASSAISAAKNRSEDPDEYARRAEVRDEKERMIARVYALYEQRLASSNALDFDDLLIRAVQLLRHSEQVRGYYHNKFRHVMVDEFQDTNGIQYTLTRLLVEGNHALLHDRKPDDFWRNRSYCVVGDESQSIYKFRGSDFNIILNFERDFPGTKTIKLEDNYRSTGTILAAANKVIANNTQRFDKVLRPNKETGEKVRYAQLYDADQEARFVVGKISDHLLRDPKLRAAVLYRTNAQSRQFEEACRRAGLRYNLVGGFSFYERAEVKDVIAYLKLALNPNDSIALQRVINTPARGIGKTTLDDIERRAKDFGVPHWETIGLIVEQNLLPARTTNALKSFRDIVTTLIAKAQTEPDLTEIVKAAVIDTGYERALKEDGSDEAEARLLNLEELVNAAAESNTQGETLRDFLDHAALVADTDQIKSEAQVTLMTIHAAKGLEFPLVFIAGLEENLFPHSRARDNQAELEEERRLAYVAITRAEKYLYLTHAMKRRVYGEEMPSEPSRFLNEFPRELLEDLSQGSSWLRTGGKYGALPDKAHGRSLTATPYPKAYNAPPKPTSNFQGKTYNNTEGVKEFFAKQGKQVDASAFESKASQPEARKSTSNFRANQRVRHAKYGQGLIVKVEGEGEDAKLTVNFPGYGHKKLIAKFAGLEKL
ncbi:MAG: UvrD-helicase domain-containing protein [Acidobacteria bacterium]|nr:UvrD-helicase domain-containing protein [Acidobacteriota bacterium]MBI3427952.1 UvrD-helicase domain-containing protein [Acidobacteriota bacterium]